MVRRTTAVLGALAGLLAAGGLLTLYSRHTTPEVPTTVVARVGDVELRRYSETVSAETVAPSDREAFGRLYRYIDGGNDGGTHLAMTAPVEVGGRTGTARSRISVRGRSLPMTAPVARRRRADGVRMAFYLPAEYDLASAPHPTDERVSLVAVPERTLAVRRFSGRPTDRRIEHERQRLLATLNRADVEPTGDGFFMGYDAPWTPPVLRRNEVAVEVAA